MKTENIIDEWRIARSKLGHVICWIEGKEASLKSLDEAYEKGVKDGAELAAMHGSDATSEELEEQFFEGVEMGMDRVWKVIEKLLSEKADGGLSYDEMRKLFNTNSVLDIVKLYSPQVVIDMLYSITDRPTKIECGDEVEAWDTNRWVKFIAWMDEVGTVTGIDGEGGHFEYPTDCCRKTGKHYDILGMIKEMEEKK